MALFEQVEDAKVVTAIKRETSHKISSLIRDTVQAYDDEDIMYNNIRMKYQNFDKLHHLVNVVFPTVSRTHKSLRLEHMIIDGMKQIDYAFVHLLITNIKKYGGESYDVPTAEEACELFGVDIAEYKGVLKQKQPINYATVKQVDFARGLCEKRGLRLKRDWLSKSEATDIINHFYHKQETLGSADTIDKLTEKL